MNILRQLIRLIPTRTVIKTVPVENVTFDMRVNPPMSQSEYANDGAIVAIRDRDHAVALVLDATLHAGHAGAKRAADHAEAKTPKWTDQALEHLTAYARIAHEFVMKDAREWAEDRGCPLPPSNSAWGAVVLRAARDGIVTAQGFAHTGEYRNKTSHNKATRLWRSNVCARPANPVDRTAASSLRIRPFHQLADAIA